MLSRYFVAMFAPAVHFWLLIPLWSLTKPLRLCLVLYCWPVVHFGVLSPQFTVWVSRPRVRQSSDAKLVTTDCPMSISDSAFTACYSNLSLCSSAYWATHLSLLLYALVCRALATATSSAFIHRCFGWLRIFSCSRTPYPYLSGRASKLLSRFTVRGTGHPALICVY